MSNREMSSRASTTGQRTPAQRCWSQGARRVGLLFAVAIVSALIAGCGGSSGSGATHTTSSATGDGTVQHTNATTATGTDAKSSTTSEEASKPKPSGKPSPLAFAECMRAHGVPNFPDPKSPGQMPSTGAQGMSQGSSGGFTANPNSPAYISASNACRSLAVASPVTQAGASQMQAAQLKFATCMRANGVPNYPDPTSSGPGSYTGDVNAPAFKNAEKKCSKFRPTPPGVPGGSG